MSCPDMDGTSKQHHMEQCITQPDMYHDVTAQGFTRRIT